MGHFVNLTQTQLWWLCNRPPWLLNLCRGKGDRPDWKKNPVAFETFLDTLILNVPSDASHKECGKRLAKYLTAIDYRKKGIQRKNKKAGKKEKAFRSKRKYHIKIRE